MIRIKPWQTTANEVYNTYPLRFPGVEFLIGLARVDILPAGLQN